MTHENVRSLFQIDPKTSGGVEGRKQDQIQPFWIYYTQALSRVCLSPSASWTSSSSACKDSCLSDPEDLTRAP